MASSPTSRSYRYLQIASTLCYVQAVFGILSGVALGIPAMAQHRPAGLAMAIAVGVEGLVFGFPAVQLRRRRRSGGWVALILGGLSIVGQVVLLHTILNVWVAANLATVLLVWLGWSELAAGPTSVTSPVV